MKHLSGLDATFLHLETPEMPMHVGGLCLFDLPPGYHGKAKGQAAPGFYDEVKRHVSQRMHLASVFTKKLALMPLDLANPMWIEASDIDLDYHVRQITLPKPGTMAQLEAYVGRLHSSLLDRSRPLWEFYIFDGLQSGQTAFYSKIHHAALDGQGAAVMAQALLDIGPMPREVAPPPARVRTPYLPSVRSMLKAALSNTASQSLRMLKGLPEAVKIIGGMVLPSGHSPDLGIGPRTPLNVSITNQRSFATLSLAVDEAKEIASACGGTLNDVVLAICSGALREYLASKGAIPQKSLLAALPVSLREAGNTELNNQVSMMQMSLASDIADPVQRIQAIIHASGAMKDSLKSMKSILPTDFPSLGLPWVMSGLVSLYGRTHLGDSVPPLANVIISNVPGARMPLYLAGAKMVTNFPVSIVAHGLALNITVQSYNGSLDFGLIACRRAVPDVANLGVLMSQAHQQLLGLARASHAENKVADKAKTVRRKATGKAVSKVENKSISVAKMPDPVPAKRKSRAKPIVEVNADSAKPAAPKKRRRAPATVN